MSLSDNDLELLERRYSMYVLLALDKMPMCTKTDIMRLDPGNEKTKFKRINDLIAEGFIECVYSSEYKSKRLNLTAEGKELVIRIKKVRALLLRHRRNRS
jgi:predicted transcriptional regulator